MVTVVTIDDSTSPSHATQPRPGPALDRLVHVDPREVWLHEAHDFTPWLAANADRLAEALGIDLEITGSEYPVGSFSVDLIGQDVTHDKPLIVENQLEPSDHNHLGQLLTYSAGTGAATIVWIATMIRDEHRQALTWLNEQTGTETHFFGVELDVVRIGDSEAAPLFSIVVIPNDWQKSVRATSTRASSGKGAFYTEFWSKFLARVQADRPGWSRARGGTPNNWFPMSVGLPAGCEVSAVFAANGKLRNEFYINRATQEACKTVFDALTEQREMFEASYGRELSWERLDNRKASRIADYSEGTIEQVENHESYIDWFIDCGDRMRKAVAAVVIP
jgi:hypothetical protein